MRSSARTSGSACERSVDSVGSAITSNKSETGSELSLSTRRFVFGQRTCVKRGTKKTHDAARWPVEELRVFFGEPVVDRLVTDLSRRRNREFDKTRKRLKKETSLFAKRAD